MAGAGGMLGEAFYEVFLKQGYNIKATDVDLNADWLSYLDFTDYHSYKKDVIDYNPGFLFHLGAFTDLEYCEDHPDKTYLTNTISVENAVSIANYLQIPLLYISTAGIFDGKQSLYDDWDIPNPLGVYARSKYMGEKYVLANANKPFVCRAGWMMGGGPSKDKKFVNKIMMQIKQGVTKLNVVDDKDGTPTYTFDFALNCSHLIKTDYYGLYNMVCGGQTSRFEVASEMLKILGIEDQIIINPVKSEFFSNQYYAARPLCERLVNKKLDLRSLNYMRDWKVCLKEYIEKSFANYL